MHTGPQFPTTPQQVPGPGGRGTALLVGGIAFAVVFLLVVGVTVSYLVLRPGGGQEADGPPVTGSSTATAAAPTAEAEAGSPTPTDVVAERCWTPEPERSSENPSGKLRGGGLQYIPPAVYAQRVTPRGIAYANDLQGAQALVEDSWYSTTFVGAVQWQPGIEYPGAEAASKTIVDCLFYANIWGEAQGRTLDDEITEPVTIAGIPGYRTTATVNFASDPLEKTDASALDVVVLETDEGPSVFGTETSIGVTEHEEAAEAAYASLTGVS
ncbi:hypothetical protein CFK38_15475 [Brachybacterium vulturis]|uniref:Uncharacterized protein n=1 Tax=Brachybacterium vulturis TaxID=2017484 RepID=A0A291GRA0_9MICO|nr:hypothetical protein [Brachybacterium vulturis]ATG52771.1 hypothetical protein CFK38_15475 [Brachybacterium vulturis]